MGVAAKRRTKRLVRAVRARTKHPFGWHGEDGGGGSAATVKPKRTLGASEDQTHAVGAHTTAVGGGGEMETMVSDKTETLSGMSFYIKLL
ncbi:hypothetical protein Tco_1421985 [Tanacetum coccineum]